MRKHLFPAVIATVALAAAAEARGPLAPGHFVTGLDEAGKNAVIAATEAAYPGMTVMTAFDVVLRSWTVEVRDIGGADTPTE